jgi:hypothetical protein
MATPLFIFTALKNSFKVHVENLESLNVNQIKDIQMFVDKRKGVFDFNTYTFVIQKRLEYKEFVKLIALTGLNVRCQDNPIISQVKPRVSFGQYKGMQYSELPDSYLLWLKGNYSGYDRTIIEDELKARKL